MKESNEALQVNARDNRKVEQELLERGVLIPEGADEHGDFGDGEEDSECVEGCQVRCLVLFQQYQVLDHDVYGEAEHQTVENDVYDRESLIHRVQHVAQCCFWFLFRHIILTYYVIHLSLNIDH